MNSPEHSNDKFGAKLQNLMAINVHEPRHRSAGRAQTAPAPRSSGKC